MYNADKKKWRTNALEFLGLCSSVEDSLLECLRETSAKDVRNFWFREQTKIGQGSSIYHFSLFTTVPITNNGRLDQPAWIKNNMLEDWLDESGVHTLRWVTTDTEGHRDLQTPFAPLHLWEGQRVWYIEFGALQLACTPDLVKRPQSKRKSWQVNCALFALTNKQ